MTVNLVFGKALRAGVQGLALAVVMGGLPQAWAQAAVAIPVAPVQLQAVGSGFELDGLVQPVKQSTIAAQVSGRVTSLLVKAGDRVRAGQLLAAIDDREAQTGVASAQAQVSQAQAQLRNAQLNFDRTKDLQRQGFVSPAAMDTVDAQLKSARAALEQAQAGAGQSSLTQGFTRVLAPFDAWVLQTSAEVGDLAVPGKPLLTVYAPMPLRVVVQLPVSRVASLTKSSVEIQAPSASGEVVWMRPAAVTSVPSADAMSQTVEWRLDIPAPAAKVLLPGQPMRVRFASGQAQRLMVPAQAVLYRGELTAVYVANGQGFALKAVRLGANHGAQGVEILAGLAVNDLVALDPVKAGLAGAQPQAVKAP